MREVSPRRGRGGGDYYTLKEERELVLIQRVLKFDGKCRIVEYPWLKDPHNFPDYRSLAYATLIATERRLSKNENLALSYKAQMEDMVVRKASRKLKGRNL